jgi:hypothetical protein
VQLVEPKILNWQESKVAICTKIADRRAPLKILLKTKNEDLLLQRWIDHHAKIVGEENLIIFDHFSDSETVKEIYRKYENRLTISTFRGFVDAVHNATLWPELYESLKQSCNYFAFLDTDEYLVWANATEVRADTSIVDRLLSGNSPNAFPSTWLRNITGYENRFGVNCREVLIDGLRWGKPIVSTELTLTGNILHNVQLKKLGAYQEDAVTNFFLLHLSELYPAQRIRSNLYKLIAHGVIRDVSELNMILERPLAEFDMGNVRSYVAEVRRLYALPKSYTANPQGSLEIKSGGGLHFSNDVQTKIWNDFVTRPALQVGEAISTYVCC